MQKSAVMQNIEIRRGECIEEIIRRQVEQGRTQDEIAADLGVSLSTYRGWLWRLGARFDTTVRFASEGKEAHEGALSA